MIILISGLSRSGKSSFADELVSFNNKFTHVPLDKYIKEVPEGISFLDWVELPQCLDWPLLDLHLKYLENGFDCFTPAPDWNEHGKRKSDGGLYSGGRLMKSAEVGYIIPGCHSFRMPESSERKYKIFIDTPHSVIAERIAGRTISTEMIYSILENNLSKNWRNIEEYSSEADLVLSGIENRQSQIRTVIEFFHKEGII